MLGLPAGGQPQGEVLPAIRNANTALQQTLSILTQIESKATSIASKINGAFGGGSMERAWVQGSTGMGMPRPSFGSLGGSAGRGSIGGFTGTIIDGEVGGGSGMPPPRFGGISGAPGSPSISAGVGSAGVAAGQGGGGSDSSGGGAFRLAARAGVTSFVGSGIGQLLSSQPGVVNDDLLYNSLRISSGGGMGFQRRGIPVGLNQAFAGGFTSHADLMATASALYGTGMDFGQMTGSFGQGLSQFARAGGLDLSSAAGMAVGMAQPVNVALGRMYGIQMNNPVTGAANNPMTVANQMYNAIYHGQKPTIDQVRAGFAPGGSVRLSLQSLGITDPSQVATYQRLFESKATTGSMNSAALGQNLNATTRDRTAAADLNQAYQFNGMAGGIEDANRAAKDLSDTMHILARTFGDLSGGIRGFSGALGNNPGSGGSNLFGSGISNAIGNVTNDFILAKLLKGGGAAGGLGIGESLLARMGGKGLLTGAGLRLGSLAFGATGLGLGGLIGGGLGGSLGSKIGGHFGHAGIGGFLGSVGGGAAAGAGIGALGGPFDFLTVPGGAAIGGLVGGLGHLFGGPDDQNHGFAMDPGTNLTGGGNQSTIPEILQMAHGLPFAYRVTSGFRPGGSSYHARGQAVDFAGPKPEVDSATLLNINQYFANRYGSAMTELIYAGPGGITMKNGKRVDGSFYGAETMSQHHNHVHVAVDPAALRLAHLSSGGDPSGLQSNSMNTSGGGLGGALASIQASAMSTRGRAMLITDPSAPGLNFGSFGNGSSNTSAPSGSAAAAGMGLTTTFTGGSAAVRAAITSVAKRLGVPPAVALAIAQHESGLNPQSVGDHGTSFGLYQLHQGGELGSHTSQWAFNPTNNAMTALSVVANVAKANPGKDWGWIAAAAQRPANPGAYANAIDSLLSSNVPKHSSGVYSVARDHLAQIHSGEMVLPARIAEAVRNALGGIGGGKGHHGGCSINLNVIPTKVDRAEAERLARMVQDILRQEQHIQDVAA